MVITEKRMHQAVLVLGSLFLLSGAFHGHLWFDESYSVAIANHSFSEIWRIGSSDVHPILIYWALHVLNLIFGQNILVYRLFTVAGAIAMAALGYTHLRRDLNPRVGLYFSILAFFMPYVSTMAVSIRMYSWAAFTVMVCALYAFKIYRALRNRTQVPWFWWAIFFVASLASAYLHYFAAISAFVVNLLLITVLIIGAVQKVSGTKRGALIWFVGAVLQVLAYVPWILQLLSQMSVVSGSYWAEFVFPDTLRELISYPLVSDRVVYAGWHGSYGLALQIALIVFIAAFVLLALVLIVRAFILMRRTLRAERPIQGQAKQSTAQDIVWAGKQGSSWVDAQGSNRAVVHDDDCGSSCSEIREKNQSGIQNAAGIKARKKWLFDENSTLSDTMLAAASSLAVYAGVILIGFAFSVGMHSYIMYYRYAFLAIGPALVLLAIIVASEPLKWLRQVFLICFMTVALLAQALLYIDFYSPQNDESWRYFEKQYCVAQYNQLERITGATEADDDLQDAKSDSAAADMKDSAATETNEKATGGLPALENGENSDTPDVITANPEVLVLSSDIGVQGVLSVRYPDTSETYLDWQQGNWAAAYEAYAPVLSSVKSWDEALDDYEGEYLVVGQSDEYEVPSDVQDIINKENAKCLDVKTFYRPYERSYFTIALMTTE